MQLKHSAIIFYCPDDVDGGAARAKLLARYIEERGMNVRLINKLGGLECVMAVGRHKVVRTPCLLFVSGKRDRVVARIPRIPALAEVDSLIETLEPNLATETTTR
mgnify:CR=1 FL=1